MDGSDEYGGRYPRTRGQKRKSDDLGAAAKSACPTPIAPHPKTHPIDEDHPCIDDDKYSHLTRTRHQKSLPAANNSASCMTISSPTSATPSCPSSHKEHGQPQAGNDFSTAEKNDTITFTPLTQTCVIVTFANSCPCSIKFILFCVSL
ncbi:uncharacterized protein LOC135824832 [Sycon ciliatum]|uniref:uncharacterized protein LOC135824832 n=1 Tax=Sycon ciliatum TaxID=27933 RepID=UPI0031F625C4